MAEKKRVLEVHDVSASYGRITALRGVSIEVHEGEIVSLVGANGAGKSTLMKAVLGVCRATEGSVHFGGRDITRRPTDKIIASGMAYVPEGGGVLPYMTVLENLRLGGINIKGDLGERIEEAFRRFPILQERQTSLAKNLSGGQRQMLAVSRALIARPRLLMLDEPSIGLAPMVVRDVFQFVVELKDRGYTILVSEQNAKTTLQCSDRAYVLETGRVVLEGACSELLQDEGVARAYLA